MHKALHERMYSGMYALLCQKLQESGELPRFDERGELIAITAGEDSSGDVQMEEVTEEVEALRGASRTGRDFRGMVLGRCEAEFEKGKATWERQGVGKAELSAEVRREKGKESSGRI